MTKASVYRCDEPGCELWGFATDGLVLPIPRSQTEHYCWVHFPEGHYEICTGCRAPLRPYNSVAERRPGTRAKAQSNPVLCYVCVDALGVSTAPQVTDREVTAMRRLTQDPDVLYALGIPTDKEQSA